MQTIGSYNLSTFIYLLMISEAVTQVSPVSLQPDRANG